MKPDFEKLRKRFAAKERFVGLLYPKACPGCGALLNRKKVIEAVYNKEMLLRENPFICSKCYKKLSFADGMNRCFKCSRPMEEDDILCRDCEEKEREFAWGRAMMLHQGISKEIMYSVKYARIKDNLDFVGLEMARRLRQEISFMDAQCMVPVPLHPRRLRERGFNQARILAEKINFFLWILGEKTLPVEKNMLIRSGKTGRLKSMSGQQRSESLKGAFAVDVENKKYDKVIIVDDIFTTGSTINECTKTLKRSGVSMVYFLTATIGS